MKIKLINVDAKFNLAIRKMYNFYKDEHEVEMLDLKLPGYPHNKTVTIDGSGYDLICISNIFEVNAYRVQVENCNAVVYGGIGSRNPDGKLPGEIEILQPYYFPDEDTSVGFITRGCIRNCWFCKVPKHEGPLFEYGRVEDIVQHKKCSFLDNNILAYKKHAQVLQWLIDHEIRCDFNQGLDIRLVTEENAELLSKLKYMGAYTFAFDDPKYEPVIAEKLSLLKKYITKPWALRFYVYYHPDMRLAELVARVKWLKERKCLPYIMRDKACWDDPAKEFLIDYTAYCNQPSLFKNISFEDFLWKRHKNVDRITASLNTYLGLEKEIENE